MDKIKELELQIKIMANTIDTQEKIIKELKLHQIELKDLDCTCYGDHYGMATNPECIIHGKNRK